MGLLSFFTRRSSHENKKLNLLKAQPYNATVASLPPVVGTYPVAGNGPDVLGTARSDRKDSQSQAPASITSKFRNDDPREGEGQGERPRTAPSQDRPHWKSYPRSDSLKAPPVPSVKGPPYRLADKGSDQLGLASKQRPPYRLPSIAPEPTIFTKPNPLFSHVRPGSVRSGTSGSIGGYVDLLDAQSNLIPTDFRHRLLATGARDYGEDVADRNLRENGINPDSAETRDFYSSNNSGASAPAPTISRGAYDLDQREFRTKKGHSSGSRSRTKSLASDSNLPYLSRTTSYEFEHPPVLEEQRPIHHESRSKRESTSSRADRRRSMPAFGGPPQRTDAHDQEADDFQEMLRIRVRDPARISRDSAAFVKENRPTSEESSNGAPSGTREDQLKSTKASRRDTISYTPTTVPTQSATRRLSVQSIQNTIRNGSRRGRPQSAGFDSQSHHSRSGSAANVQDSPSADLHMTAYHSPRIKQSHKGQESRDVLRIKTHNPQTPVFSPNMGHRRLEIDDSIPDRGSSLRNLSIDSTSGTSLSSSPFRPHSRHTANTSVDLAPSVKGVNSSRDSLGKTSFRTAAESWGQSSSAVTSISSPRSPLRETEHSSAFNIDDYISSDGESEGHQVEEPEELLFRDTGYGFEGAELPGLTGLLDMMTSRPTPPLSSMRTRSLNDQALAAFHQGFSGLNIRGVDAPLADPWIDHSQHRSRPGGSIHNIAEDSDLGSLSDHEVRDYHDDLEDDFSFDIPLTRHDVAMRQYRQSRYATREEDIEEEKEFGKLDISTAVRLRKEAKRRNRQSGVAVRRRTESGNEREVSRQQRIDPDGFEADIE